MIGYPPNSISLPSYVCGPFYNNNTYKLWDFEVSRAHGYVVDLRLLGGCDAKLGTQ